MATIYSLLINQNKVKYQTVFSAKIDEQYEDGRILDEIRIFNILITNQKSTQIDFVKI